MAGGCPGHAADRTWQYVNKPLSDCAGQRFSGQQIEGWLTITGGMWPTQLVADLWCAANPEPVHDRCYQVIWCNGITCGMGAQAITGTVDITSANTATDQGLQQSTSR